MMQVVARGERRFSAVAFFLVAVSALVLALALPRSAAAGEYTIDSCQADDAGYASGAFEDFATRGMRWRRACNPLGPGLRGLVTANVPGPGRVPAEAQSDFVMPAPPGTTFSRLRWSGHAHRRDCRYALQVYAERPGSSAVTIKNVRANRGCPRSDVAQASSWPRPRNYNLEGATRIVQRVVCVGSPTRNFCSARGQNYIRTFSAEATVVDGVPPTSVIAQSSPIASGAWVSGKQGFSYEATDNVGVKSARAMISGTERAIETRGCDYSQRIPCPNGSGSLEVATDRLPEGSQPLTILAEDAAGNRAESAAVTARIDNTAPGAVAVGVAGGETWRNQNGFAVGWANQPEPDRAPITAVHYKLCRAGTGECVAGDQAGASIAAIENLNVPAPGEWDLRLWREDAAGNQQADNASQPVALRFDPEPPEVAFEPGTPGDPTRVSVLATDRVSGVSGGGVEISPVGSGNWQALPTQDEGDHLIARIDDAAMPAGEYELRASARDLANNLTVSDHRLDGQPMRLKLPLRTITAMKAGIVSKRTVLRTVKKHGKKRKVRRSRTVLESRDKVPFGRTVRFGGRLVNPAGHPLADATVTVYSRLADGGEETVAGTTTTNGDGHFSFKVEARSSRKFRFAYSGSPTVLPIEGSATLLVEGATTFKVKPKHVLNGDSVLFSGRVKGRPLPPGGKLLELQVDLTDEWSTFQTLHTDSHGFWKLRYPFKRTCGVVVYAFRVLLPEEEPYPLEESSSHQLRVRVKGQPC